MDLRSLRRKLEAKRAQSIKSEKKNQSRLGNGRWSIIVLFALTVLASLFFYLRTELPQLWQKMISPAIISTLPEGAKFDPHPVVEAIESLTQDLRGTYAFYVYRWQDGNEYGLNQDQVLTAASLIKLPVMLAVYREGEKGNLDLDDYRERLEAMGKHSDNAAFNQLVKFLREEKIQRLIEHLGMESTSLVENKTTAAEIGSLFRQLYDGKIINEENREEMLGFLTDTEFEDRIPAGVPEEVRVAHKIGTEIGSFSDGGIILADKPFVLVIISENARESEANQALPAITERIWEFENEGS